MKVLLVDLDDYQGIIRTIHGLKHTNNRVYEADLIIDRDTGKVLKSRYF